MTKILTQDALLFFVIVLSVFYSCYFMLSGGIYLIAYKINKYYWASHKIQSKFPDKGKIISEINHSIVSLLIISLLSVFAYILYKLNLTQIIDSKANNSLIYNIVSFLLYIVLHDLFFYWSHRLMHTNTWVAKYHIIHHQSTNPTPFSSYSFHPVEAFIQGLIIPISVIIIPMQPSVIVLTQLFTLITNIVGHMGYEIHPNWFRKTWIGWISNFPTHHNVHHQHFKNNYGLHLTIWDRMFGTFNTKAEETFLNIKNKTKKNVS